MNAGNERPWKSSVLFVAFLITISSLGACGDGGGQIDPATNNPESAADDEATERYREKVKRQVSASIASSLSREWGVPEARVECVLGDLRVSQLGDATTDATVSAIFNKCGVDPIVTE